MKAIKYLKEPIVLRYIIYILLTFITATIDFIEINANGDLTLTTEDTIIEVIEDVAIN